MQINIKFELKPKQRPKLAEEIATALHTVPCYQKAPSLAYKIGDCTLEKDGTLRIPDSVDRETVSSLLEHLKEKGFMVEAEQTEDRLTVSIPKELFTQGVLENLAKLVENKGGLMARAFQVDEIRLTVMEDAVSFPWFPFTANPDETAAYTEFVEKLCRGRQIRRTALGGTGTENTRVPAQVQIGGDFGVYWLFKSPKRDGTKRNETHLGVPRNRMKWGFSNDRKPYE